MSFFPAPTNYPEETLYPDNWLLSEQVKKIEQQANTDSSNSGGSGLVPLTLAMATTTETI